MPGVGEGVLRGLRLPPATVRATLQGTRTPLRYAQAKKEQLAARVREIQAMLAVDTGRLAPSSPSAWPRVSRPLPRVGVVPVSAA